MSYHQILVDLVITSAPYSFLLLVIFQTLCLSKVYLCVKIIQRLVQVPLGKSVPTTHNSLRNKKPLHPSHKHFLNCPLFSTFPQEETLSPQLSAGHHASNKFVLTFLNSSEYKSSLSHLYS